MTPKNHTRAVRYRQLALAEPDKLAERDMLCTVEKIDRKLAASLSDPARRARGDEAMRCVVA